MNRFLSVLTPFWVIVHRPPTGCLLQRDVSLKVLEYLNRRRKCVGVGGASLANGVVQTKEAFKSFYGEEFYA